MAKRILIGLHDSTQLRMYADISQSQGYLVDVANNLKDMLQKASTEEYTRYFMDINLDSSNSADISSAEQIYALAKPRVESGLAKFMAISGNDEAVKAARKASIPAEERTAFGFDSFKEFLRE